MSGVLEYTGADFRDGVAAVSFDWHVWKELKLFAAPGVEIEREDGISITRRMEIAPAPR